jgi:hypothetical protein
MLFRCRLDRLQREFIFGLQGVEMLCEIWRKFLIIIDFKNGLSRRNLSEEIKLTRKKSLLSQNRPGKTHSRILRIKEHCDEENYRQLTSWDRTDSGLMGRVEARLG